MITVFLRFSSRFKGAASLALAALLLALTACTRSLLPRSDLGPSGRVEIAAILSQAVEPDATAVATLTRQGLTRSVPLALEGEVFRAVAEAVPVGAWQVTVQLFDGAGDVTHEGSGTVWVSASEEAALLIEMAPKEASLEIVADLAAFPAAERVERARVTFHTNQVLTLERGDDGRFYGVKALPPGDYDFSIGLYGSSFYASERIYESPWQSVKLYAGKTARVLWEAATGRARLSVVVRLLPSSPEGLRVEWSGSEAHLLWDPLFDPEVSGYRVYVRKGVGLPYEKEAEVSEADWPIAASLLKHAEEVWFVVTSVTADGRESYRSAEVALRP